MLNVLITLGAIVAAVLLIAVVFPLIGRFLSPGAAPIKIPNPFKKLFAKESDGKKKESDGKKLAGYFIPSLVALGVVFLLIVIGLFVATKVTVALLGMLSFWGVLVAIVVGALLLNKKWTGAYVSLIIITILMMLIFGWDRDVSNAIASSTSTSSATRGNTSTGEPRQPQVVRAERLEDMPDEYGEGWIYVPDLNEGGGLSDELAWSPPIDVRGDTLRNEPFKVKPTGRPSPELQKKYDNLIEEFRDEFKRVRSGQGEYRPKFTNPGRTHRTGEPSKYTFIFEPPTEDIRMFVFYGEFKDGHEPDIMYSYPDQFLKGASRTTLIRFKSRGNGFWMRYYWKRTR